MCVSHKKFHEIHTYSFFPNHNPNPNAKPNPNPKHNPKPNPYPNPNHNPRIDKLSKQGDYLSK